MSRIGDGSRGGRESGPPSAGDGEPWPAEAESRVRSLRSAITSEMGEELVDTEIAPLLPDLLTRLEAVSEADPSSDLSAPDPPDAVAPPSPADEMHLLRRVESKLEAAAERTGGKRARAVDELAETLSRYRELREEVLIRSEI